eukprot:CAMPEP_0172455200 /NCGR_PEP_ID=MMETSP1065-20121228/11949_1 /TAXON_ID=265537 /ORGANISM="Amphiprora paludosa, Strain CCMP125" /LENGTH=155 /DNA_ID=CAMNT_0013207659 /DNA_START=124 /DNA_END=588 /DNA_ORIENTATION=+
MKLFGASTLLLLAASISDQDHAQAFAPNVNNIKTQMENPFVSFAKLKPDSTVQQEMGRVVAPQQQQQFPAKTSPPMPPQQQFLRSQDDEAKVRLMNRLADLQNQAQQASAGDGSESPLGDAQSRLAARLAALQQQATGDSMPLSSNPPPVAEEIA